MNNLARMPDRSLSTLRECPFCNRQLRGSNFKKHVQACGRDPQYGNPNDPKYRGVKRPHTCEECGEEFLAAKCDKRRYCSKACSGPVNARGADYAGPVFIHKTSGRAFVRCRDGSDLLYYRALMEAHLGRELDSDEVVHHINGDHTDDRLENLQVLSRSEHMRLHWEQWKGVA